MENGPIGLRLFGAPLPPNKRDFTTGITLNRVSKEEFARLMNTEDSIVLRGAFEYTDSIGTPYKTGFCVEHLVTGAIAYCGGEKENYIQ